MDIKADSAIADAACLVHAYGCKVKFETSLISIPTGGGSNMIGAVPFLHYENIWFIPVIFGSLAVLAVAVELDKRARRAVTGG